MVLKFSSQEVVTMAVELEKKGIEFYSNLEKQAGRNPAGEVFSFLKGEEEKHLDFFSSLLSEIKEEDMVVDTRDETNSYLGAIVENGILGKVLKGTVPQPDKVDLTQAVELGIEIEKESVLFYQGLGVMVPPEKKGWLEKVISEEKKHFLRLIEMKSALTGGGEPFDR